jgi:hypothetical protein
MAKKRRGNSSKSLGSASHSTLRRASPSENIRMGFTPTARRYVKVGVKVTKATASVSHREAQTKRTQERHGFHTPEAATKARREGALSYESQTQARRVDKADRTRLLSKIEKAVSAREKIPYDPLGHRGKRHRGRLIALKSGDEQRYRELRERKLRGEDLDIVDFVWLMDMANRFGDPAAKQLRGSPGNRSGDDDYEPDFDEAA